VPLDPTPSPVGENVLLRDDVSIYPLGALPIVEPHADPEAQARRFRNHFATCTLGAGLISFAHLDSRLEADLEGWYASERSTHEAKETARRAMLREAERRGSTL
jgi:hypothetical protein